MATVEQKAHAEATEGVSNARPRAMGSVFMESFYLAQMGDFENANFFKNEICISI